VSKAKRGQIAEQESKQWQQKSMNIPGFRLGAKCYPMFFVDCRFRAKVYYSGYWQYAISSGILRGKK
jgi:hypothetical protein